MEDLALNKRVLEYCNHYQYMTAETHGEYNDKTGYCAIHWPGYITIDLEGLCEIKQISFQLWDYEDITNTTSNKENFALQQYAYRLQTSMDKKEWTILYDTASSSPDKKYRKGWQTFILSEAMKVRYIRIHAIHNRLNSGFHIVRLHAFEKISGDYHTHKTYRLKKPFEVEIGDAYPISYQLLDFSERILSSIPDKKVNVDKTSPIQSDDYNDIKQKCTEIANYLFLKSKQLDSIDGKVDGIRQLIANPINRKIQKKIDGDCSAAKSSIVISTLVFIIWMCLNLFKFWT